MDWCLGVDGSSDKIRLAATTGDCAAIAARDGQPSVLAPARKVQPGARGRAGLHGNRRAEPAPGGDFRAGLCGVQAPFRCRAGAGYASGDPCPGQGRRGQCCAQHSRAAQRERNGYHAGRRPFRALAGNFDRRNGQTIGNERDRTTGSRSCSNHYASSLRDTRRMVR